MTARVNYAYMVTHDWLRAATYDSKDRRSYGYVNCPDYHNFSHPTRGWCKKCGAAVTDWDVTRKYRIAASLAAGPLLLPVTGAGSLIGLIVTGRQPVQREERDYRLAEAEAELAEANHKLDQVQRGGPADRQAY